MSLLCFLFRSRQMLKFYWIYVSDLVDELNFVFESTLSTIIDKYKGIQQQLGSQQWEVHFTDRIYSNPIVDTRRPVWAQLQRLVLQYHKKLDWAHNVRSLSSQIMVCLVSMKQLGFITQLTMAIIAFGCFWGGKTRLPYYRRCLQICPNFFPN